MVVFVITGFLYGFVEVIESSVSIYLDYSDEVICFVGEDCKFVNHTFMINRSDIVAIYLMMPLSDFSMNEMI